MGVGGVTLLLETSTIACKFISDQVEVFDSFLAQLGYDLLEAGHELVSFFGRLRLLSVFAHLGKNFVVCGCRKNTESACIRSKRYRNVQQIGARDTIVCKNYAMILTGYLNLAKVLILT